MSTSFGDQFKDINISNSVQTLKDFLPAYPSYVKSKDDLFNIYEKGFYPTIYYKKEFLETKLPVFESKPQRPGQQLLSQKFASRFFSPHTPYESALIFHGVGTGKTCLAVQTAIMAKKVDPKMKRALILTRGPAIKRVFVREIAYTCTAGGYLPPDYRELKENERNIRIRRRINQDFEITTYYTLAKKIARLSKDFLKREFSNRVIVVDEAHNIRKLRIKETGISVYKELHRLFHSVENCRILLLTATPMRDKPSEIANLMNLILPLNQQMNAKTFANAFFKNGRLINKDKLKEFFRGRISYVRSMERAKKIFEGEVPTELKKFPIVECVMSKFQAKIYKRALLDDLGFEGEIDLSVLEEDVESAKIRGLYDNTRQASMFVFPTDRTWTDGIYGKIGFDTYMIKRPIQRLKQSGGKGRKKKKEEGEEKEEEEGRYIYNLSEEFRNLLTDDGKATQEDILNNIHQCSCKFGYIICKILENPTKNTFIYSKTVTGSGAILLGELLTLFDFSRSNGVEAEKAKRYSVLTGKTSYEAESDRIREYFNNERNRYGEYDQVIIGSQVIGEGTSIHNVRQCFIASPHWNFAEIEQAIGRGIRAFSHEDLKPSEREYEIYCLAAVLPTQLYDDTFTLEADVELKAQENRCDKIRKELLVASGRDKEEFEVEIGGLTLEEDELLSKGSYLNKDQLSIDLAMYKVAEDKDIQIRQVIRVMKEMAVDCALNRDRNIRLQDVGVLKADKTGSRECEYQNCDYQCEGIDPAMYTTLPGGKVQSLAGEVITDTYNLYYAETEIERILNELGTLFRKRSSYDYGELLHIITDVQPIILLRSLKTMIDRSYMVRNRFGIPCYLREYKNYYYLVDDIGVVGGEDSFSLSYYLDNPSWRADPSFSDIVDEAELKNFPDVMDFISKTDPVTRKKDIIANVKKLNPTLQELILESVIIAQEIGKKEKKELRDVLYEYFKSYIVTFPNVTISWLLLEEDKLRCLPRGLKAWRDCPPNTDEKLIEYREEKKGQLLHGKYYGIIGKNRQGQRVFRIRKLLSEQHKEANRRSGGTTGSVCHEMKKPELINIAMYYNIPIPKNMYPTSNDRNVLLTRLSQNLTITSIYPKKELNKLTKDQLQKLEIWDRMSRRSMCEHFEPFFIQNNLIEPEIREIKKK